jgi:Restriction endonuclease
MAKKQSDEASAEAARRRPQKKTAAPKPGRGRAAKPTRPVKPARPERAAKPARPVRGRKPTEPPAQAELPIGEVEVVEDAIVEESAADTTSESPPVSAASDPAISVAEVIEVDDQPPTLSAEEQELTAIYGDDLARPAIAHAEYADRQTADEDRPMVPEINARDERKLQWQERRDRRRRRRDERDRQRHERRDQPHRQAHDTRPDRPERSGPEAGPPGSVTRGFARGEQRPAQQGSRPAIPLPGASSPAIQLPATNGQEADSLARVGTPLGDAAATVFAQLRNGQPLPVRQLAAMMRKRSLVETDPDQLWPQLKAELLGDERSYRTLGLRPRIVYRGRDLFAPGPVAMSQTADAEANVAAALSRLAGATHRALAARIAHASGPGFERLIHAYLVAAGYRDIAWIKRIGGIAYASAVAPGIDRTVLISARSGDQPIDRRGIGELRVGVEAKDLVAGILFSARELSEDAERELERAGRSISVICGDQLVAALIAAGVGVVSSAAPIHYVDDQLLDELLAG